ncbi:MAG: hypothetical protein K6E51_12300 [Treponema sp.]|nr:hypothetical protein [Treponema sp.]
MEFYMPENLEPNTDYRIVIETSLATNGVPMKSTAQVISDIVQVQ